MSDEEKTKHWVWFEKPSRPIEMDGSDPVTYEGSEVPLSTVPMGGSILTYSMYGAEMQGIVGPPPSSVVLRVEVWQDGVKPLEVQNAAQEAIEDHLRSMGAQKVTVKTEYCFVPSGRPVFVTEGKS